VPFTLGISSLLIDREYLRLDHSTSDSFLQRFDYWTDFTLIWLESRTKVDQTFLSPFTTVFLVFLLVGALWLQSTTL
jgi:hypothetical protein